MPLQLRDKSDFIPELTINTRHPQAESVQHPFFSPSNRWSARLDPNPSSLISPSFNLQMANQDQALQVNLIFLSTFGITFLESNLEFTVPPHFVLDRL
jgi:hypothetical protein